MKGFFFAIMILIGARGLGVLFPMACSILTFLIVAFLAFYTSLWLKFVGSESIFRCPIARKKKEPLLRSQNIVATLPAYEKAEQYLYRVAHYDSKSQTLPLILRTFLEKGYQAVSLACVSRKILNVNTAKDMADQLEEEGMDEVGKFILTIIQNWEKAP